MNKKLITISAAASVLFSINAYAADDNKSQKKLVVNVPITIGQDSRVKSDTLKYKDLTEREKARAEYLQATAKTKVINNKIDKGDFEGAALGLVKSKKLSSNNLPNSLNPSIGIPGIPYSAGQGTLGSFKDAISSTTTENGTSLSSGTKAEKNMPEVTDVGMVNGKIIMGVYQDGKSYAVGLNEPLKGGYKITAVDSVTATVLTPKGKKVRVYITGKVAANTTPDMMDVNGSGASSQSSTLNTVPLSPVLPYMDTSLNMDKNGLISTKE